MANAGEANAQESLVFSDSPGQPKAAPACSLLPGHPDRLPLQPAASADGSLTRVELAAAIRQNPGFREKVATRSASRAHSREAARSGSSGGHSAETPRSHLDGRLDAVTSQQTPPGPVRKKEGMRMTRLPTPSRHSGRASANNRKAKPERRRCLRYGRPREPGSPAWESDRRKVALCRTLPAQHRR